MFLNRKKKIHFNIFAYQILDLKFASNLNVLKQTVGGVHGISVNIYTNIRSPKR